MLANQTPIKKICIYINTHIYIYIYIYKDFIYLFMRDPEAETQVEEAGFLRGA